MGAGSRLAALLGLAGPGLAAAADSGSYFDLYYAPRTEIRIPAAGGGSVGTDGGDAFGFEVEYRLVPPVFLDLQYQYSRYDGVGGNGSPFELDWVRFGVGCSTAMNVYLLGQVLRLEGDAEGEGGFGAHLGYRTGIENAWELRGQVGYLDLNDVGDGLEWLAGGAFTLSAPLWFFADYRVTTLRERGEAQFTDVLAGVRVRF